MCNRDVRGSACGRWRSSGRSSAVVPRPDPARHSHQQGSGAEIRRQQDQVFDFMISEFVNCVGGCETCSNGASDLNVIRKFVILTPNA